MKPKLSDAAKGKWPSILPKLGVAETFLTGRHGPCPICAPGGCGTDRFRFDNKDGKGSWICSQCGSGDGIELVKRVNGWEFKRAAPEIEALLGTAKVVAVRQGRDIEEVRREMTDIWRGGKPLAEMDATRLWWMGRAGEVPVSTELRAVRSLRCPGQPDWPGMVARVMDATGKPVNLHRTYLSLTGDKAPIPEARRVMDAPLPKGCAVRLFPATETLGIAEGIETAVAAHLLFDVPVWALLTAQNMTGFVVPEGVKRLIVFGDHDRTLTGHWASYTVARAHRMMKDGPEVEVRIPTQQGQDWNDELVRRRADALLTPQTQTEAA